MKKIAVILSGNGVYDGAEIHESVLTLLAIDEAGAEAVIYAPDMNQYHVINHITGEEMPETRNVLVEAARIARGKIHSLSTFRVEEADALVIPGGFGAAKNLTQWAFSGPEGAIREDVKKAILDIVQAGKPLGAVCMGPAVVAKALQGSGKSALLTVGTTDASSPYDIAAVSAGLEAAGARAAMKNISEIAIDENLKIVTGPCYMMEASISQVRTNVKQVIDQIMAWLR